MLWIINKFTTRCYAFDRLLYLSSLVDPLWDSWLVHKCRNGFPLVYDVASNCPSMEQAMEITSHKLWL